MKDRGFISTLRAVGSKTDLRPAWLSSELFPFEIRFVDVDDTRAHYVDEGSGPVLLFLPGAPNWSFFYRHLVAALRDDFRCIALDYPGFGLSGPSGSFPATAPALSRFVERFNLLINYTARTFAMSDAERAVYLEPYATRAARRNPAMLLGDLAGNDAYMQRIEHALRTQLNHLPVLLMYATPLGLGTTGAAVLIPLTFGADADWCRNVLAAGSCSIKWRGDEYAAVLPEVVDDISVRADLLRAFDPLQRFMFRAMGTRHFLRLQVAGQLPVSRRRVSLRLRLRRTALIILRRVINPAALAMA